MTPSDLKSALTALGWRTSKSITPSNVDWYAWLPRDLRPAWHDCTSNDKPPSFCIEPHAYTFNDGAEHGSVEFRLCGEVPGGHWLDLKLYSVDMKDCIKTIPVALALLGTAWDAAHEMAGESVDLAEAEE